MFENFEPVYVINLKKRKDKKNNIINLFKKNLIFNYFFIEAFDKDDDLSTFIYSKSDNHVGETEIAITMSHLKAIKFWIETSNSEYAIICEDDIDFELSKYWNFTWKQFMNSIPYEYDILQLAICFNDPNHNIRMHKKIIHEYSASFYLIKRKYAIELINKYFTKDGLYNLNYPYSELIADYFSIFKEDKGYSMALLIPDESFGTDNENGWDSKKDRSTYMQSNRDKLIDLWKNNSLSLSQLLQIK